MRNLAAARSRDSSDSGTHLFILAWTATDLMSKYAPTSLKFLSESRALLLIVLTSMPGQMSISPATGVPVNRKEI